MTSPVAAEMKEGRERPILFSGEMVRAILEGRKTQTRRVVKPQLDGLWGPPEKQSPGFLNGVIRGEDGKVRDKLIACPFGQVGDRLWVRETFQIESNYHADARDAKPPFNDGRLVFVNDDEDYPYWEQCHYAATDPCPELLDVDTDTSVTRWRPSIHMPRWASRITLEVTGVRVERLQEITMEDAVAEGILGDNYLARQHYFQLWNSLNAKRGFSAESNLWVWVIEFKRLAALRGEGREK